jgi:ATP-dependent helicase/DNAse subunit B
MIKLDLTNYKQETDILYLSASKINKFYNCPLQFFFQYLFIWEEVEKPEQTKWPGTGFGEAVHKVLEIISYKFLEGEKDLIEQAGDIFKETYDRWLETNKDTFKKSKGYNYKKFIKKGMDYSKLMSKFLISFYGDNIKDLSPEEEFTIKVDEVKGVLLKGFIDLIYLLNNDEYNIIDFKTTKDSNKFYFIDWEIDTQSLVYLYYCYKEYGKFPETFRYLILNHEEKTLFFKEFDIENIDNIFDGLIEQIKEIKKYVKKPNLKLANPEKTKCFWCEFNEYCPKRYTAKIGKLLKELKR